MILLHQIILPIVQMEGVLQVLEKQLVLMLQQLVLVQLEVVRTMILLLKMTP